eukprot:2974387-Amphidinium_carterae.3
MELTDGEFSVICADTPLSFHLVEHATDFPPFITRSTNIVVCHVCTWTGRRSAHLEGCSYALMQVKAFIMEPSKTCIGGEVCDAARSFCINNSPSSMPLYSNHFKHGKRRVAPVQIRKDVRWALVCRIEEEGCLGSTTAKNCNLVMLGSQVSVDSVLKIEQYRAEVP